MSIAFTPGEPAGIGPDLAVIYAQKKEHKNLLVFTDPDLLLARAKKLNLCIKIKEKNSTSVPGEICVFPIKINTKTKVGVLNPENAKFVLNTLDVATQHCLDKQCDALVTGPVHKGVINQSGINFTGHTEYLANLSGTSKTVMMLATEGLRVALATTHIPLSSVSQHIQVDSLKQTIKIIHNSLQGFGLVKPCSLRTGRSRTVVPPNRQSVTPVPPSTLPTLTQSFTAFTCTFAPAEFTQIPQ